MSNISTIHLVGLAEGGYLYGPVIGNFEWMATLTLIVLVFAPYYFKGLKAGIPEGRILRTDRETMRATASGRTT